MSCSLKLSPSAHRHPPCSRAQGVAPGNPNRCNSPVVGHIALAILPIRADRADLFLAKRGAICALDDGPKRAPPPHMPRRVFSPTTSRGPDEGAQKGIVRLVAIHDAGRPNQRTRLDACAIKNCACTCTQRWPSTRIMVEEVGPVVRWRPPLNASHFLAAADWR